MQLGQGRKRVLLIVGLDEGKRKEWFLQEMTGGLYHLLHTR